MIALTLDSDEIAIWAPMKHPPSDSTILILGVDLNHRSPGYEPGGMDLATLPRFQLHNARRLFKRERLIPRHIPHRLFGYL
jgi:hypothetical protein